MANKIFPRKNEKPAPLDPCDNCRRRDTCRLPLNCERYLAYRREADRLLEDRREAKISGLGGQALADLTDRRSAKRYLDMAEDLPWREGGVLNGEKV